MEAPATLLTHAPGGIDGEPLKLYYIKCSFHGFRPESHSGSFTYLIRAKGPESAVQNLISSLTALASENPDLFPKQCEVYVDALIEVLDPIDHGLVFGFEEKEDTISPMTEAVKSIPIPCRSYESILYETNDGSQTPKPVVELNPKGQAPQQAA